MMDNAQKHGKQGLTLLTMAGWLAIISVLFVGWIVILEVYIQPQGLMMNGVNVKVRLLYWILPPLLLLLLIVGGRTLYLHVQKEEEAKQQAAVAKAEKDAADKAEIEAQTLGEHKQFSLEVRGFGMVVGPFLDADANPHPEVRKDIWEALDKATSPYHTIMPQDPHTYIGSSIERIQDAAVSRGYAWRNAAQQWVSRWPIPLFMVGSSTSKLDSGTFADGLYAIDQSASIAFNLYLFASVDMTTQSDKVLGRIFDFFDQNPEVPAVALLVTDALEDHQEYPEALKDSYFVPPIFDACEAFILTRTDRVNRDIRPYTTNIPISLKSDDTQYDVIKVWRAWRDAEHKLAQAQKRPTIPSVTMWQQDYAPKLMAAATQEGVDGGQSMTPFWDKPKAGFKPNSWVPVRWTKWQLEEYDNAPILGYLHRPVYVSFTDEHGSLLKDTAKNKAMVDGWKAATETLPPVNGVSPEPARIFYDTGKDGKRILPLSRVLADLAPDLDPMGDNTGYNIGNRIGNTGISAPYVQIGLGLMRSYHKGGISASVNLDADGKGASIIMIRPPTDDLKKSHGNSANPFLK